MEKWFHAFKPLDEQLAQMKAAAMQFAGEMLNITSEPRWLCLLGTSGAGKTMLARIITTLFRQQLEGSILSESRDRLVRYRGGFIAWSRLANGVREGDFRTFEDVGHDWFIAVDDIGSEHPSAFINSKLFEFSVARERRWTVWTANLSLQQIGERYDPRIASRMIRHGSVVVDVDVPDFNLR